MLSKSYFKNSPFQYAQTITSLCEVFPFSFFLKAKNPM
ncbi:hypothetical protein FH5_03182 [Priestia endophytica]|nr:hypothetical protein FH5_03182 [Priestia endophytica]